VETGAGRLEAAPGPGGWYSASLPSELYRVGPDGGEPVPDPRSGSQPEGLEGPTAWVDQAAFAWTDADWRGIDLAEALIYELHVGTFTPEGTFEAVIGKLDHLVGLGVSAIELMPVGEFSGRRNWGYDLALPYAPHHAYGGPRGLKRLVDACHARGLGVLMDVVYNHLGPIGNHLERFGPYFSDRYATAWGRAFNLDGPGSDQVRAFLIDNALMWLRDYHCDGLRLDAVHAIVDTSAVHILEELAERVRELEARLERRLLVIAESDLNDPRLVRPPEVGGYGLDAQWSDDFHHALHTVLTGERSGYYADFGSLADLAQALRQAFVYDGRQSGYRQRRHGRSPSGLSGHRFLGYLQNHDQVGNRAQGERISQLVDTGLLKVGAALVLTSPFVPMLFMGEEWGAGTPFLFFSDHQDPAVAAATSQGRVREFAAFGWRPEEVPDPQSEETFLRSKLDWTELSHEPHAEILDWYRRLVQLRRSYPELRDGDLGRVKVDFDETERWLTLERGRVKLRCNFAHGSARLDLPSESWG
jgi:maltooligosyltrehalose trehalohydrolase